jgi:hypothetical protein
MAVISNKYAHISVLSELNLFSLTEPEILLKSRVAKIGIRPRKPPEWKSTLCFPPQESSRQCIGFANRQGITAKYSLKSIFKGSTQMPV